jgi:FixJ family two-component response regulator
MSIQNAIVAVVDDDARTRRAMRRLLYAFGYTTCSFDSAEAFLRTAAGSKANCLVVDIQLGEVSGIELARRLSKGGFKFPIIFMTAVDNPAILGQVSQLGCIACLRKPFSADQLIEAIVKALG